jgi:hypothetical protein
LGAATPCAHILKKPFPQIERNNNKKLVGFHESTPPPFFFSTRVV